MELLETLMQLKLAMMLHLMKVSLILAKVWIYNLDISRHLLAVIITSVSPELHTFLIHVYLLMSMSTKMMNCSFEDKIIIAKVVLWKIIFLNSEIWLSHG